MVFNVITKGFHIAYWYRIMITHLLDTDATKRHCIIARVNNRRESVKLCYGVSKMWA